MRGESGDERPSGYEDKGNHLVCLACGAMIANGRHPDDNRRYWQHHDDWHDGSDGY